ncbi:lasso peptide biosynthesis B2 protein [Novosphingobium sp.]|uniref:lasso peptide biosynthesis B2 protein n=1 Tax=Novosphingobium sp. TaxID=1874826 RepID=UPI003525A8D3
MSLASPKTDDQGGALVRAAKSPASSMLPTALETLAWCVIDGTAIFLDLGSDRYFRLPDVQNRDFVTSVCLPALSSPCQPASLPLPPSWIPPVRQSAAVQDGPFHVGNVARALWVQRRVERRLARNPLSAILHDLRSTITSRCDRDQSDSTKVAGDIRAFQQARLLRSAADRCLPRSIALALCLASHRCRAHVVLGVKLAPFAAHCWTQLRDEVLNDEVEEVLRYQPILIV